MVTVSKRKGVQRLALCMIHVLTSCRGLSSLAQFTHVAAHPGLTKNDLGGAVTVHKLGLCAMTLAEEPTRHKKHEGLTEEP